MARRIIGGVVGAALVAALVAGGGWWAWRQWRPMRHGDTAEKPATPIADGSMPFRVSAQARANMGIRAASTRPTTYWRKIEVPGILIDRPGVSDRGVTAPVTGVVAKIHSHP